MQARESVRLSWIACEDKFNMPIVSPQRAGYQNPMKYAQLVKKLVFFVGIGTQTRPVPGINPRMLTHASGNIKNVAREKKKKTLPKFFDENIFRKI